MQLEPQNVKRLANENKLSILKTIELFPVCVDIIISRVPFLLSGLDDGILFI